MLNTGYSFSLQLGELSDAEVALAEANILNNKEPTVWGFLALICLQTARKVEAEQTYKYAVRVCTFFRLLG